MIGFDELIREEKDMLMDKGIYFGLGGALLGYFIADQQHWGSGATMGSIAGGHFLGHSLAMLKM